MATPVGVDRQRRRVSTTGRTRWSIAIVAGLAFALATAGPVLADDDDDDDAWLEDDDDWFEEDDRDDPDEAPGDDDDDDEEGFDELDPETPGESDALEDGDDALLTDPASPGVQPEDEDEDEELLVDPTNPRFQMEDGDEDEDEELLVDPTNPRFQPDDGDEDEELLVDPTNPRFQTDEGDEDEELLVDPTNPRFQSDDGNADEETLVDPTNTRDAVKKRTPSPRTGAFSRLGFFTGRYTARIASDLGYESPHEDVFEFDNQLDLAVRFDPAETLDVLLEARLRHRLTVEHGDDEADEGVWAEPEGRFDAELREAYLRWTPGDFALTVGNQFQLWGAMDVISPAQLVHPSDLRAGPIADGTDALVPVFAADLKWFVTSSLTLEFILVPFFTGPKGAFFGNDFALVSPGGAVANELGVAGVLDDFLDEGLGDAVDRALGQTGTPDEQPQNVSLGARIAGNAGGVDLGLAWYMDWDPQPVLTLDRDFARVLNAVLSTPAFLQSFDLGALLADPLVLLSLNNLQNDPRPIDELVDTDYRRRHAIAAELETYLGPVGIRSELVFSPSRTVLVTDHTGGFLDETGSVSLQTRRVPVLDAVLGLSWESSDARWVLILEGFYRGTFDLEDDQRPIPDDAHTGGLAFALRTEPVDDWETSLGTIWTASAPHDVIVTLETAYRVIRELELFAELAVFEGADPADDLTRAGLFDHNDYIGLGVRWTL